MTAPRDFRWWDAPRPDPDTGRAPLAPTAAADDVDGLLREADAYCAEWERAGLRSQLIPDLALNVWCLRNERDALRDLYDKTRAERDDARRERDRLARRLAAVGAIARGAPFRLDPDPPHDLEADAGDPP